jgi:hypothetical protein
MFDVYLVQLKGAIAVHSDRPLLYEGLTIKQEA